LKLDSDTCEQELMTNLRTEESLVSVAADTDTSIVLKQVEEVLIAKRVLEGKVSGTDAKELFVVNGVCEAFFYEDRGYDSHLAVLREELQGFRTILSGTASFVGNVETTATSLLGHKVSP
jgi:hypothetical protein